MRHGRIDQHLRERARPSASLDERLRHHGWTEVDRGWTGVDTPCWEWNGYRDKHGYGQLQSGQRILKYASRAAYEAWVGEIASGFGVLHRCDNPPCINPGHLFVGDQGVNIADMLSKRREANGERHPQHRVTDAEVDEIRTRYAAGGVLYKDLAMEFGLSKAQIGRIIRGERRLLPTNPPLAEAV